MVAPGHCLLAVRALVSIRSRPRDRRDANRHRVLDQAPPLSRNRSRGPNLGHYDAHAPPVHDPVGNDDSLPRARARRSERVAHQAMRTRVYILVDGSDGPVRSGSGLVDLPAMHSPERRSRRSVERVGIECVGIEPFFSALRGAEHRVSICVPWPLGCPCGGARTPPLDVRNGARPARSGVREPGGFEPPRA